MDYSIFENVEDLYKYLKVASLTKQPTPHTSTCIVEEDGDKKEYIKKNNKGRAIQDDKLPVVYADLKTDPICVFKNIIVFTNDRSDNNKTLKNIKDAISALPKKPNLYVFVAAKCDSGEDGQRLTISDDKTELVIEKESNLDTIIFSRLGVQGEDDCEHAVQLLQDRGFLVLNPVKYSKLACNKYESARLFEKGDIPQPRFCLMTKEILYDEDLFKENIARVYPSYDFKDPDKNEKLSVVIKILDGHGGTGVFTCDCKKMIAILQAIFAIDPERKLLIQKKEEADGGDIRVHVLTLRNKQVILAAMKRVKLGGDFRSNVSLGAQAEPVKLTQEQEQIALKTAALSRMPWCAVDIMPLIKGSNKEIGDNVVLEINASPGTQGISDVIKTNFINVLLNELDDPTEFMLQDKTAGFIESATINFGNIEKEFLAKLDTGNSTHACTLEVGRFEEKDGYVTFNLDDKELKFQIHDHLVARAGEHTYTRPTIVVPCLKCGLRKVKDCVIALVESRENKSTNLLMNRDTIGKLGYVVHPSQTHILTKEMEKVKIV